MATRALHVVCPADELAPGARRIVDVDGVSIGVFNIDGSYHAVRNLCPHRGGPLCEGTIGGTMLPSEPQTYRFGMDGRLLRCPWHGWEIDIATGTSALNRSGRRARTYPVSVIDGQVVIEA